jgi:hypothetical protein
MWKWNFARSFEDCFTHGKWNSVMKESLMDFLTDIEITGMAPSQFTHNQF